MPDLSKITEQRRVPRLISESTRQSRKSPSPSTNTIRAGTTVDSTATSTRHSLAEISSALNMADISTATTGGTTLPVQVRRIEQRSSSSDESVGTVDTSVSANSTATASTTSTSTTEPEAANLHMSCDFCKLLFSSNHILYLHNQSKHAECEFRSCRRICKGPVDLLKHYNEVHSEDIYINIRIKREPDLVDDRYGAPLNNIPITDGSRTATATDPAVRREKIAGQSYCNLCRRQLSGHIGYLQHVEDGRRHRCLRGQLPVLHQKRIYPDRYIPRYASHSNRRQDHHVNWAYSPHPALTYNSARYQQLYFRRGPKRYDSHAWAESSRERAEREHREREEDEARKETYKEWLRRKEATERLIRSGMNIGREGRSGRRVSERSCHERWLKRRASGKGGHPSRI